ncbi:MAG: flagellar protein FlgN [Gammaproteobacteria bacterium]|nr:flagellar protein FlgN [Gammaproteobacteria bacterium]
MNIIELEQELNLQLHTSQLLLSLLGQENDALIARDIDLIEQLAQQKQHLIEQLNSLDSKIERHLLPDSELPSQFSELKNSILENISTCQRQNDINGKAIALSLGSIERLQNSLVQKRAGNSMTYNQKGKTRGGGVRGSFISA